jgi:hypothetical protein
MTLNTSCNTTPREPGEPGEPGHSLYHLTGAIRVNFGLGNGENLLIRNFSKVSPTNAEPTYNVAL